MYQFVRFFSYYFHIIHSTSTCLTFENTLKQEWQLLNLYLIIQVHIANMIQMKIPKMSTMQMLNQSLFDHEQGFQHLKNMKKSKIKLQNSERKFIGN